MKHIEFIGNGDGEIDNGVHFVGERQDTLCGIGMDDFVELSRNEFYKSEGAGDYVYVESAVNCPDCIAIVTSCKKIRKREYAAKENNAESK